MNAINERGRMHGRTIDLVMVGEETHMSDGGTAACVEATQDQPTFIVVGWANGDPLCYIEQNETQLLGSSITADRLEAAKAGLATDGVWERVSGNIAALEGLSIAALNGTLAGGAFGMALACDMRIAVPGAKFFYPVMKLGYLPQPSDPGRMAALIGPARTKLILMGGQKISADEALAYGLIERIVPPEDLLQTARDIAADTLAANPDTARAIKAMCGD